MPHWVVARLAEALDRRLKKPFDGSRILLIGLAYKKNVEDMRESPSLKLIELIEARGGRVDYHDSYIPVIGMSREHAELAGRRSVPLDPSTIAAYDAVLISTDHDDIDYAALVRDAKLVVDTRNACARAGIKDAKVISA
jgi:UDP-N-acetyl-D-glucosamine dehydrogenase